MRCLRFNKCGGAGIGMGLDRGLISGETGKAVALMAKSLLKVERGVIAVVVVGDREVSWNATTVAAAVGLLPWLC
jgi:hypothetical protein